MLVILTQEVCAYLLMPVNKRIAARMQRKTGEDSVIFQTDWDWPYLARNLGWDMRKVQHPERKRKNKCDHSSTDGTVTCRECGLSAGDFISAAAEWLDNHDGHVFRADVDAYFDQL